MASPGSLAELVPAGNRVFVRLAAWVVGSSLALTALAWWAEDWTAAALAATARTLQFGARGTLADWLSSAVLLLAGQVTLVIGWVQSKNADDFNGRYRIWTWAALFWLAMSVDETARIGKALVSLAAAAPVVGHWVSGPAWSVVPFLVLLGLVGGRVFWEMRGCWASTAILQAAAWVYILAGVVRLGLVLPTSPSSALLAEASELIGHVFLLLSMTLHARHCLEEYGRSGRSRSAGASTGTTNGSASNKQDASQSDASASGPHFRRDKKHKKR